MVSRIMKNGSRDITSFQEKGSLRPAWAEEGKKVGVTRESKKDKAPTPAGGSGKTGRLCRTKHLSVSILKKKGRLFLYVVGEKTCTPSSEKEGADP